MKTLLFFFVLVGCTQKYGGFDVVRKADFDRNSYQRPQLTKRLEGAGKDDLHSCFNQWLFFSNAEKEKNKAVSYLVRSLCPGKDYLIDTELTETWWTTIIFTRSCVDMTTQCAELVQTN